MDENIKLEDEEMLFVGINPESRIKVLNDMGIFTVKDFLDADSLLELKNNGQTRNPFIVYQQILKYKYREQKMDRDIYLDREYTQRELIKRGGYTQKFLSSAPSDATNRDICEGAMNDALTNLGLYVRYKTCKQLYECDQISMMDAIKLISQEVPKFEKLCDFYLEYYEKEIKKSTELTSEDKTQEELENMSEEELQQIIANNDQTIEENNVAIKKALVQRILAQQKTISEQQSEMNRLNSQKQEL